MNLFVLLNFQLNVLTLLNYLSVFFLILIISYVIRSYYERFHNPRKLSDLENDLSFEVVSIVGDRIKLEVISKNPPSIFVEDVNYYSLLETWYEITEFPEEVRKEGQRFKIVDKTFIKIV